MAKYDQFEGFRAQSAETWLDLKKEKFDTKPFGDYDVDIKIECCGMCSSDCLTLSGGWGDQKFPLAVGHEIVGKALRVGPKVSLIKAGQRVGVGAQSWSCLECKQCKNDNETCVKPFPYPEASEGDEVDFFQITGTAKSSWTRSARSGLTPASSPRVVIRPTYEHTNTGELYRPGHPRLLIIRFSWYSSPQGLPHSRRDT